MPKVENATTANVEHYLHQGLTHLGAGIRVLICMLAVESRGSYPPMDRKFAAGLRACKKVSKAELTVLLGKNVTKFAHIYVTKVIPAWSKTRKSRSPEEADNYWGRGGRDARPSHGPSGKPSLRFG